MTYDDFGRVIRKTEDVTGGDKPQLTIYEFAYNPDGSRKSVDVSFQDATAHRCTYAYDKYGRLTRLTQNDKTVQYEYDKFSRISRQIVNGTPITFMYTATGQLESKAVGTDINPLGVLKYTYSPDGQIISREVNGRVDKFGYNTLGQLVKVSDGTTGIVLESYKYDAAGNILSKTVGGKTTTYTYDKANQLVSSTAPDGTETEYEYDGAGRMVKEGDRTYTYGWRDKVLSVSENGDVTAKYDYHADGQLASVDKGGKTEEFFWDGLALIKRGGTSYVNEPAVTGGNPVLATNDKSEKVLFNDMLGSTMGSVSGKDYKAVDMTLFGESKTEDEEVFFTGKPEVDGLGYAFAFRNYRSSLGKWQTADPLGYPDGWNNKAYCLNRVTKYVDPLGLAWTDGDFISWYYIGFGEDLDTDEMGLTDAIWDVIEASAIDDFRDHMEAKVIALVQAASGSSGSSTITDSYAHGYYFGSIAWVMGGATVKYCSTISFHWNDTIVNGEVYRDYWWTASAWIYYYDEFADPFGNGIEVGIPYSYFHTWTDVGGFSGYGQIQME